MQLSNLMRLYFTKEIAGRGKGYKSVLSPEFVHPVLKMGGGWGGRQKKTEKDRKTEKQRQREMGDPLTSRCQEPSLLSLDKVLDSDSNSKYLLGPECKGGPLAL